MTDDLYLRDLEFVTENFIQVCLCHMDPVKRVALLLKIAAVTSLEKFCLLDFEEGDVRCFGEMIADVMVLKGILK